jgi:hypothetical protein
MLGEKILIDLTTLTKYLNDRQRHLLVVRIRLGRGTEFALRDPSERVLG